MAGEELIEQKLGILQKIRKTFFLMGMNPKKASKYQKLPIPLKNDSEIVDAVMNQDDSLISQIPYNYKEKYVVENPQLINKIYNSNQIAKLIETNPELAGSCDSKDLLYTMAYSRDNIDKTFIKFLPNEMQTQMLSENVQYHQTKFDNGLVTLSPNYINDRTTGYKNELPIEKFSEDVILKLAIKDKECLDQNPHMPFEYRCISSFKLNNLSKNLQLKLLLLDERYNKLVSKDVLEKYVNGNPLLIEKLPNDIKYEYIKNNPSILKLLSRETQSNYSREYRWTQYYPKTQDLSFKSNFDIRDFSSPEEAKNKLIEIEENKMYKPNVNITDIRNDDFIWEIGKFSPRLIETTTIQYGDYAMGRRSQKLMENMLNHLQEGELKKYLQNVLQSYNYNHDENEIKTVNTIMKCMLNDDVLKNIPQDKILDFAKTQDHSKLVEIIRQTYGNTAARILEDRPEIEINDISNLYIFNPKIIDEFGIGAIHATLSYNMEAPSVFSELARNPEKMERFRKFKEITNDMFGDTAIDLENQLKSFVKSDEILKSLNGRQLTPKEKNNLESAINTYISHNEQVPIEFPKNIEELNSYSDRFDKIYQEAIEKMSKPDDIKEAISKKYFGMNYKFSGHYATLGETSVVDMCRFYNLEEFTKNPDIQKSLKITPNDLDALEILDIIQNIDNPKILQELSKEFDKNQVVINPKHFRELKKKVPELYKEEVVSSLMTLEKAEKMIADGEEGISIREEDGVKVVTLNGVDFKAYISNPYLNNSSIKVFINNKDDVANTWKNAENGISTFSGCLVDQSVGPGMIVDKSKPNLGFYSFNPNQIVAMSSTDAHLSHTPKELSPTTTEGVAIKFGFSEELLDRTSERLHGNDEYGDFFHKYNEIASQRRVQNLNEVKEGTSGGKINPDYVFSYGLNGTKDAIKMAKEFESNVVFEYNPEPYRAREYERQYKKYEKNKQEKVKKEDSQLIKSIKKVVRGEDGDER